MSEIPFPFDRAVCRDLIDEDNWVRRLFCACDPGSEDCTVWYSATRGADGEIRYEPVAAPTGHIRVDGEPMAFWLPGGVTAESINLNTIEQEG